MPEQERRQPARPPEHYVHADGQVVIVPARVARRLVQVFLLDRYHVEHRGEDPELDAVIVALRVAGLKWATSVGVSEPRKPAQAMSLSSWLSSTEIAGQLGIGPPAVRLACREGRLPAELVDGRWRVSREDFEHWRAARKAA